MLLTFQFLLYPKGSIGNVLQFGEQQKLSFPSLMSPQSLALRSEAEK